VRVGGTTWDSSTARHSRDRASTKRERPAWPSRQTSLLLTAPSTRPAQGDSRRARPWTTRPVSLRSWTWHLGSCCGRMRRRATTQRERTQRRPRGRTPGDDWLGEAGDWSCQRHRMPNRAWPPLVRGTTPSRWRGKTPSTKRSRPIMGRCLLRQSNWQSPKEIAREQPRLILTHERRHPVRRDADDSRSSRVQTFGQKGGYDSGENITRSC
jgi:hypothetical protein